MLLIYTIFLFKIKNKNITNFKFIIQNAILLGEFNIQIVITEKKKKKKKKRERNQEKILIN